MHRGRKQIAELTLGLGDVNVETAVGWILTEQTTHLRPIAVDDEQPVAGPRQLIEQDGRSADDLPLDRIVVTCGRWRGQGVAAQSHDQQRLLGEWSPGLRHEVSQGKRRRSSSGPGFLHPGTGSVPA